MSPEQIAEGRRLLAEAETTHPWHAYLPGQCCDGFCLSDVSGVGIHDCITVPNFVDLIVWLRNHAADLLDAAETLRATQDDLTESRAKCAALSDLAAAHKAQAEATGFRDGVAWATGDAETVANAHDCEGFAWRHRAEKAEAEVQRLRNGIEALADEHDISEYLPVFPTRPSAAMGYRKAQRRLRELLGGDS
jgi:hypothetical protein